MNLLCNDLLPSFHSFPGGKRDPEDNSIVDTAVREMEEELGLERSCVQVWAQMPAFPDRVSISIWVWRCEKSVHELISPPRWSLLQFPSSMKWLGVNTTPHGWDTSLWQNYPPEFYQDSLTICPYPFVLMGGGRDTMKVKCLAQECNTGLVSNLDLSTGSLYHSPVFHCTSLSCRNDKFFICGTEILTLVFSRKARGEMRAVWCSRSTAIFSIIYDCHGKLHFRLVKKLSLLSLVFLEKLMWIHLN